MDCPKSDVQTKLLPLVVFFVFFQFFLDVFQRWQQYPYVTGPETEEYSCLGIFKGLVDSPYFPK